MGHDLRHCANHFTATKSGSELSYQYGDWLKAIGGRSTSPTKRYAEKKSGNGEGQGVRQPGHSSGSAVETSPTKKPEVSGKRIDENTGISGSVIESALRISEINAGVEADKEIIGGVNRELMTDRKLTTGILKECETDGVNGSNGCAIISEGQADMEHVETIMHDGPEVTKPKSTWVRLQRKVHGPSENVSKKPLLVVGKRKATEPENRDSHTGYETQIGKKGKTAADDKEDDQISARVAGHPCRKQ
nr:hypothetical protein CFP56_61072 [Quercus suber]